MRQLARKLGIDLGQRPRQRPGRPHPARRPAPPHRPAPTRPPRPSSRPPSRRLDYGTPGTRIKLAGLRRKIAEHMVDAKQHHPALHLRRRVRRHRPGPAARAAPRARSRKTGVKLTYLPFFVKAVGRGAEGSADRQRTLDEEAGEIVLHDRYHIGIAVADAGRADRAGRPRRRQEGPGRRSPARSSGSATEARAGKSQARGPARRHVHDHVDRQHRRADLDADHQSPRGRHPGRRQGRQAAGLRRRRQHPAGGHGLPVVLVRPPRRGRGRRRGVRQRGHASTWRTRRRCSSRREGKAAHPP